MSQQHILLPFKEPTNRNMLTCYDFIKEYNVMSDEGHFFHDPVKIWEDDTKIKGK